ncbi:MAG: FHA domain-containing protein, partial [Acidobacteriota bacterium]
MSSTLRYLRLRGRLGDTGPPFLAELAPGVHRLGSVDDNDIVVRFHGVSRHHLLIRVEDKVSIEDLGSKNGTRVNGRTRTEATLEIGDELFVGPVRLRLEAVEADDVRLAITADPERTLFDVADLELDGRTRASGDELDAVDRLL